MQLVSKKNFIILLAAVLVVGFGLMSMYLNQKKVNKNAETIQTSEAVTQAPMKDSDKIEDIESDLNNTDLDNLDKDLQGMEQELNKY